MDPVAAVGSHAARKQTDSGPHTVDTPRSFWQFRDGRRHQAEYYPRKRSLRWPSNSIRLNTNVAIRDEAGECRASALVSALLALAVTTSWDVLDASWCP